MKDCFHDAFENLKPLSPKEDSDVLKELHICNKCGKEVEVSFWKMPGENGAPPEWIPQWHKENSRYKI